MQKAQVIAAVESGNFGKEFIDVLPVHGGTGVLFESFASACLFSLSHCEPFQSPAKTAIYPDGVAQNAWFVVV